MTTNALVPGLGFLLSNVPSTDNMMILILSVEKTHSTLEHNVRYLLVNSAGRIEMYNTNLIYSHLRTTWPGSAWVLLE